MTIRIGTVIWVAAGRRPAAQRYREASWLNHIEAEFTVRCFTLDDADHSSHADQVSMIRR
jgi:hypothetical protein